MTPEQRKQIDGCKNRIVSARRGGCDPGITLANLRAEGWPEAAIQAALKELEGE